MKRQDVEAVVLKFQKLKENRLDTVPGVGPVLRVLGQKRRVKLLLMALDPYHVHQQNSLPPCRCNQCWV